MQPLSLYSYSKIDYKTIAVWCPSAAQHSGQLSDSSGGTFKKWINTEAAAGNLRGLHLAQDLVKFCQNAQMFAESNQKRFLEAKTVRRQYYHLSKAEVLDPNIVSRRVASLPGLYSTC